MKFSDLTGLFRKTDINLVNRTQYGADLYIFDFAIDTLKPWRAGEHGAFSFPNKKIKGKSFRGFSIASIPGEGVLKIATRIPEEPSSFKAHMLNLKTGDIIRLRGPFGWFTLQNEHSPVVLIAGGIGISPIRALMKEFEKGNKRSVALIYSDKADHLFKDELQSIADADPLIKTFFVRNREDMHKQINKKVTEYGPSAYYYLSGNPPLLRSLIRKLRSKGIPRRQIITDPFFGY